MARWTLLAVVAVVVFAAAVFAVTTASPDPKGSESLGKTPKAFSFFDDEAISRRTISPTVDAESYNHITFTAEIRGAPTFLQIQLSNDREHWIPLAAASGDCDQSHNPLTFGGGSCLVSARYYRLVVAPKPRHRLVVTVLSHLGS